MGTTLREITADNLEAVRALRTTPDQERFVSTVAFSLAEAAAHPEGNPWFRAVYDGEEPMGFARLGFEPRGDLDPDGEVILRLPLGG